MVNESRRKFLTNCFGALGATMTAVALFPIFRFLAPRSHSEASSKVIIAENEIAEGSAKFFEYSGSSAVLVKKKGGELVALSAVCTHLGCIVQWEKDQQTFLCPCHAGHYSVDGEVTAGPPPKALPKIPFIVADGKITVG